MDDIDTGTTGEPGSNFPDGSAEEDRPLSDRVGRDPSNLGDEVSNRGDIVYPDPEPPDNNL
jgi:hypothetical protein